MKQFQHPKRKLWLLALLIAVLGSFLIPSKLGASPQQVLKVVADDNYPPYCFRESNGKLVGILVDQWRLWEEKTGIRVELTALDWAKALDEMQAGKHDVIDTIFRNPDREKVFLFSQPYARIDVAIFFHRNISGISGIDSLKGFNIGVKRGDHAVTVLRNAGIQTVTEFNSYKAMVQEAGERNLQILLMDKPPALYFLYRSGLIDTIRYSEPLYYGEFHRAVRKDDPGVLRQVEDGFAKISQAEYAAINRKWFGSEPGKGRWNYRVMAAVLGAVLLGSALLILWNWILHRTVRRKTRDLAASGEKFRKLLTDLSIGVIVHDVAGTPTFWNKAALQILGLTEGQLTGQEPFPAGWEYVSAENERLEPAMFPARRVLSAAGPLREFAMGIRDAAGQVRWFQVDAFPDQDSKGKVEQVVVTFYDTTARRQSEEKLIFISFHDALTGVYNRAYFEEELRRLDNRHNGSVAIVVADVDGMKRANDTWGHAKGDELLIRAAGLIRRVVRQEDVVARIGGDEFAVIMRNADEASVVSIIGRLHKAVEEELLRTDEPMPLSLSFGHAFAADPAVSVLELFKTADNRMYQEKAQKHGHRI